MRARWIGDLTWDVSYAIRTLSKRPDFAVVALLSISLSVGVTSVVFAAVKAVILDPLPYTRPEELIQVATDFRNVPRSNGDWIFWNDAQEIARRTRTLESVGIYGNAVFDLPGDHLTPPEALYGLRVSATLFPTLGVSPMLGRNILPGEDQPGRGNVILLSHGLWSRRFNSDKNVIGRKLQVNGRDGLVIGVMPPGFNFPLRREAVRTPAPYVEFWAPLQIDPAAPPEGAFGLVARLRHGVSVAEAQADVGAISSALAREFPASNRDRSHRITVFRQRALRGADRALWFLLAAASMFLLIGCANVANLLLARGFSRQREIAIRMAIGAGRARIVRQLLTESCVLAVLGGAGGFATAAIAWRILPALVPVTIPRISAARADWAVLGFALLVAVTTGVIFGIAPALRSASSSLSQGAFGARGASAGKQDRLRASLVIAEIAITVLLVVVGGQFGGRFLDLLRTDPGFDADHVLASVVLPAFERYKTPEQRAAVYRRFLEAVRSLPGVDNAGTVDALPFSGENHGGFVRSNLSTALAEIDVVGGQYLQAMGVRLLEGRWFRDQEMKASSDAAIVDDAVARKLWPKAGAIGQRLCVDCTPELPDNWKRVIGVVSSMRHSTLEGTAHNNVYLSAGALESAAFLVVRTNGRMGELEKEIRSAIAGVDPNQPVLLGASMRSFLSDSIADRRFVMSVLGITGCLALLMAAAGVYGVASYMTSRRTQEIGIRMALGATPANVLALIFRQGFVMAGAGLLAGLGSAFLVLRVLRGLLEGFESGNLAVTSSAAALVLVATIAACWIPARRATQISPVSALRQE